MKTHLLATRAIKAMIIIAAIAVSSSAEAITRQQLINKAQSLNGKCGAELMTALHALTASKTVLGYGSGNGKTWYGFYSTDRNPQTNECYNRYSSKRFYFTTGSYRAISGMNIEHSFPKSWWGGTENDAYKDLYNLYPSDASANSSKSNYAMGIVTNVRTQEPGYDKVGTGTIDGRSGTNCWEPGDQYKGDFARSYMYMAAAYNDFTWVRTGLQTMQNGAYPAMKAWATTLYRQWSSRDKVDSLERARNNAVAKIQGNRNYFIDIPYIAEYLWGDSVNVALNLSTTITTADDDNRYMKESTSTGDDDTDEPTQTYIFRKVAQVVSGNKYLFVVNTGDGFVVATPLSSGQGYGYLPHESVKDEDGVIKLTSLAEAFSLETDGSGYFIIDHNGRYYYQKGSYKSYNVADDDRETTTWNIEYQAADGTFVIKNAAGYYMQYNPQYKTFGCYTTRQGLLPMLYEYAGTVTAISSPTTNEPTRSAAIYNLQGQRVGSDASQLPAGIYIRNGRKFVVR